MEGTKLVFSEEECFVIQNARFFEVKQAITKKVSSGLATLGESFMESNRANGFLFPEWVNAELPKIWRGENYNGLPYIIMDFPRGFQKERICAFRSMFWWGKWFSLTLHLRGKNWINEEKVFDKLNTLQSLEYLFICVNTSEWDYHYGQENYRKLKEVSLENRLEHFRQTGFLKVSAMWPMEKMTDWLALAAEVYPCFAKLIQ